MIDGAHPASFRDPSGFLFRKGGELLRQVNLGYRAQYDALMASGLYPYLVEKGRLIPHCESDNRAANSLDRIQSHPARTGPLHLLPLRVVLRRAEGCGAPDPADCESRRPVRDDAQGRIRLQRSIPGGETRPDRHAFLRHVHGRRAVGCVPTVLPAFSGAACVDGARRRAPEPADAGLHRRHSADPGREIAAVADPVPARPDAAPARACGDAGKNGFRGPEERLSQGDGQNGVPGLDRIASSHGPGPGVERVRNGMGGVLRREQLHGEIIPGEEGTRR